MNFPTGNLLSSRLCYLTPVHLQPKIRGNRPCGNFSITIVEPGFEIKICHLEALDRSLTDLDRIQWSWYLCKGSLHLQRSYIQSEAISNNAWRLQSTNSFTVSFGWMRGVLSPGRAESVPLIRFILINEIQISLTNPSCSFQMYKSSIFEPLIFQPYQYTSM